MESNPMQVNPMQSSWHLGVSGPSTSSYPNIYDWKAVLQELTKIDTEAIPVPSGGKKSRANKKIKNHPRGKRQTNSYKYAPYFACRALKKLHLKVKKLKRRTNALSQKLECMEARTQAKIH